MWRLACAVPIIVFLALNAVLSLNAPGWLILLLSVAIPVLWASYLVKKEWPLPEDQEAEEMHRMAW